MGGENNNVNYSIKDSKSFWDNTEKNRKNNTSKKVEIVVSLKYLSNFWRTLDMPLINCGKNLILTWSKNYVLTSKVTRDAVPAPGGNPTVSRIQQMQYLK